VRVPGFLRGQTHAHSSNSGDSDTPAADVLRWYAARGYDFVVITDHNYVTVVPADERPPGILAIPGAELTQNLRTCQPPPPRAPGASRPSPAIAAS
jgi:predicted metal-dependent phosphoesterase TrpH